jgi:protein-S-isoprenylcysteine O-methyltransferase Ste14
VLYVRALFFTLLLPGTVTVLVPWFILRGGTPRFDPGAARLVGILLVGLGAGALLWCIWDFARFGRGTLAPVDPPKQVVRRGLYAHVRNPMYLGVVTALCGEALTFGARGIATWAAVVALGFHLFVVLYEEPTLHRLFGASYDDYRRDVPRWLPRLRAAPRSDS